MKENISTDGIVCCRYIEKTSEWTLDYPPFFALFELGLSQIARWVNPEILVLSRDRVDSPSAHAFLRASVIASDAILIFAGAILPMCVPTLLWLALCTTKRFWCCLGRHACLSSQQSSADFTAE
jgi:hypothetical protein